MMHVHTDADQGRKRLVAAYANVITQRAMATTDHGRVARMETGRV